MIDLRPLTLLVGTVTAADFSRSDKALIDGYAVCVESFQNILGTTFNFSLFVGILQAEIKHAIGSLGCQAIDHCCEQHAEMEISGRARGNSGYPRSFLQRTRRI